MAYSSWSVVFGEQPSSAKWNLLGANDATFYQQLTDGWIEAGETWTYVTAATFTISGDQTGKYNRGDRIRLKQGGNYKYFVIIGASYSAPNTTITILVNTDYVLASATITDNYYSKVASPAAYPDYFNVAITYGGFSVAPTQAARMSVIGRTAVLELGQDNSTGTSNATTFTITVGVSAQTTFRQGGIWGIDNTASTVTARAEFTAGSAVITLTAAIGGTAWTGLNAKGIAGRLVFEID